MDFFSSKGLKILDISFGSHHTLVLCKDMKTQAHRVFGCGQTEFGQLCKISNMHQHNYIELTEKFPQPVEQISAGSLHSLFVTRDKKLYACGNNNEGQLGFKSTAKVIGNPTEVKFANPQDKLSVELVQAFGGSLYSMALCRTADTV